MKVLFVLEHYYPYIGGAETLFQTLAEALVNQGYSVRVITTRFREDLEELETYNGVDIQRIDCSNRFLFSLFAVPAVLRAAPWADVIHTTTYNAALPAWIAGKIKGKKIIITFHEVWNKLWFRLPFIGRIAATAFYTFEQLLLFLSFDHYIAVSEFTKTALQESGIPSRKITRIYNGLDNAGFKAYSHQPPVMFTYTYFGRLGISKGLDLLLPAAAIVRDRLPESQLVLIIPRRPSGMYERILQMIRQLDLSDYVQLRHELTTEALYQQIATSSCVVIPSYSEGFCFVAAESVAIGVPIVSSGQGALAETVTGQHVEMHELTATSLANAIIKARNQDFEPGSGQVFGMEVFVREYLQFYRNFKHSKE